ncbi:MAG: DNA internalization-related competence protein ComEC/Rec2 [Desulfotomaculum sp.]|nr:DNA internalization-related competence protein ComEC/Rec2 [Desulfotomaculum sp.]
MGVITGHIYPTSLGWVLVISLVLLITAVICYLKCTGNTSRVLAALCFCLGIANSSAADLKSDNQLVSYLDKPVSIVGAVVKEPDARPDKVFYLLKIDKLLVEGRVLPVQGLVQVCVYETDNVFTYGDLLYVNGKLKSAASPGNPGQFDYRQYLQRRGIYVVMPVWDSEKIKKVGTLSCGGIKKAALTCKNKLTGLLEKTLLPEQSALVQGMLFGSRGMISEEVSNDFQTASMVHILCVSGFHVALVLAFFMMLFYLLRLPPAWEAPAGTMVLFLYALMTGMGPAVTRAVIMGVLALWARQLGREKDWPTAMALAAVIILWFYPWALFEPGFQLSFAVAWGLLYLTPTVQQFLSFLSSKITLVIAVPLVAELTAAPLIAYHYNMISLVGIAANIISVPLVSLIMLLSGISILIGLIFIPAAYILNASTGVVLDLLFWIVKTISSVRHAAVFLPSPPFWMIAVYYFFLACIPYLFSRGKVSTGRKKYICASAAVLIIVLLGSWFLNQGRNVLAVHFIDVGQGDAALVQMPAGKNLLIDTGGWKDEFKTKTGAGNKVVLPYLKRLGINSLDVLILSHPHEDHAGGAAGIIKRLPVKLVVVAPLGKGDRISGIQELPATEYKRLLSNLDKRGIMVKEARAGDRLRLGDKVAVKILSPSGPSNNLNDSSLVVKITYGQCIFLFTGDIEKDQQYILVKTGTDLHADVLKVPHHGSSSFEPEFFKAVNPQAAVISVGQNNRFGHPAPETIKALKQLGSRIYRTDTHGAVIVKTDGKQLWIQTGRKSLQ